MQPDPDEPRVLRDEDHRRRVSLGGTRRWPVPGTVVVVRRVVLAVLLVVLGACGLVDLPQPETTAPGPGPTAGRSGDVATRSLSDVERFWTAQFPKLSDGAAFTKVRGGYHPYTRRTPPPDCGDQPG